jgi:hypothetical protein
MNTNAVISSAIDALRTHPIVLAMLLFNALVLGIVLWGVRENRVHQGEILKAVLAQNDKVFDALTVCNSRDR